MVCNSLLTVFGNKVTVTTKWNNSSLSPTLGKINHDVQQNDVPKAEQHHGVMWGSVFGPQLDSLELQT